MTKAGLKPRRSLRRLATLLLILLLGGAVLVGVLGLFDAFSNRLEVTEYRIATPKVTAEVRLAVLADLHGCSYGPGQQELVEAIAAAAPHAVLYAGDVLDDKFPHDHTLTLFEALQGQYPAYYAAGNHEFWSRQIESYKAIVERYGITVLSGETELLQTPQGQRVAIAGVDDPAAGRRAFVAQLEQVQTAVNPAVYTLLLSHRPEKREDYRPLGVDLVLSGHAHGGQWRLPLLLEQGLLAPNQGLFPRFTSGLQQEAATDYIASRGLAKESTPLVPRIFNRPELVIVILEPALSAAN